MTAAAPQGLIHPQPQTRGAQCVHISPPCPTADRPDRDAARTVAFHPGRSLLCNGVIVLNDMGEILPGGRVLPSHRPARARLTAAA